MTTAEHREVSKRGQMTSSNDNDYCNTVPWKKNISSQRWWVVEYLKVGVGATRFSGLLSIAALIVWRRGAPATGGSYFHDNNGGISHSILVSLYQN